jgi:hypothetical protein
MVTKFVMQTGCRSLVVAGLVPATSIKEALTCQPKRDTRDKPAYDTVSWLLLPGAPAPPLDALPPGKRPR